MKRPETELIDLGNSRQSEMQCLSPADEYALLRQILKGDKEQFRYFVSVYRNRIFSLMRRQVNDVEIARDLTQETFLKAFTGLAGFRFESSFSTWITCIAMNHLHSFFSSRRFKEHVRTTGFEDISPNETVPGAQHEREVVKRFQLALGRLSAPHREVLALVALEGKSYEEVAGLLGIPLGTVRSRLNKARVTLKELLSDDET